MDKITPRFKIENNVLKGMEIPLRRENIGLGKKILDILESNPDLVGQIEVCTGEEYSYGTMRERSVRCALWMKEQGLIPGDVISVCSHNQMDTTMPCFAALYLGAVFNPLDAGLNAKDLHKLLNVSKPKIVFVSEAAVAAVAEAAQLSNLDLKIVVFGRHPEFFNFENVIAEAQTDDVKKFKCTEIEDLNATALIMGTSGTTGLPKGVAISNATLVTMLSSLKISGMAEHTCLVFSTLSWMSGVAFMLMNLQLNIPRLVAPYFEVDFACEIIEKYKVSWLMLAPSMLNRMLKSDALSKYNLTCMKLVICGGAHFNPASEEAFVKLVPNVQIISSYGCTEVGGVISVRQPTSKSGSCGQIGPNMQVKVIDPESGQSLGANEQGEILVKTEMLMNGYYGNPQATAEAIDKEGWLHTGDLGYYDEEGDIFVVDRLKELIKYRGYQISPSEIENVIWSHPGVKDVAVIGLPHPVDDEQPLAFVVRAGRDSCYTGKEVTEGELVDLVAAEVSDSKRLRGGVRFVDQIPRTTSNKIQRRKLRELATVA